MTEVSGLSRDYVTSQLRLVDLLRALDDDALEALAERVVVQDHEPGRPLLDQGGEPAGMHMVLRGTAIVERDGVELAEVGPGEHVGEIALLDGRPRVATVRAREDLRTGYLTSEDFLDVLEDHPDVALEMLLALASRFRFVEERLATLEAQRRRATDGSSG